MLRYEVDFPRRGIDIPCYGNRDNLKPDLSKKIVTCFGCSHTYGVVDETWPSQLQQIAGDEYQVLNMGRRNYGFQLNIWWHERFVDYQTHCVIIQLPQFFRRPYPNVQKKQPIAYTMTRGSLHVLEEMGIKKWTAGSREMMNAEFQSFTEFVTKIKESSKVGVILYEASIGFLKELQEMYFGEIARWCKKTRVPVVDLDLGSFQEKEFLQDVTHPNCAGNRYIAELCLRNFL